MKRIVAILLVISLLFSLLCGCKDVGTTSSNITTDSDAQNSSSEDNSESKDGSVKIYRDHQQLTASEIIFDDNNMMRISIPEVGLENVFIQEKFNFERVCPEGYGDVYLLGDDRYGGGCFPTDTYLAIQFENKLFIKDLSKWENNACYDINMELCDVDGNPDVEIVLNVDLGGVGGMGSYLSRVFDFKDGQIIEMFSSIDNNGNDFDTGFSIEILNDRRFKIKNKFTGYCEEFVDSRTGKDDKYSIYWWYDPATGKTKDISLWVDSFYQFSPIDIDQNGVYEILCRQYVCLIDHSDGIGSVKTILKYDINSNEFKIINTEFENEYYG